MRKPRVPKVPNAQEEPTPPAEASAGPQEVAPPAAAPPPPEYLKVVIILRDGRSSIGVQRFGCDPVLVPLPDAGLANAIARLPEVVTEADARWREQRQNPKYTRPAPPPRPPAAPRAARAAPAPATPAGPQMPPLF